MSDHVYKQIELTGSSQTSIEDAIRVAITKASASVRNMHWFQVTETRGFIETHPSVIRVDVYGGSGVISGDVIVSIWEALAR